MRRVDRQASWAEAIQFLTEAKEGVLAMVDVHGAPYAIPVNHALIDGYLVIHCAAAGRKIDCLRADNRICHAVYRAIDISPKLTATYTSAVVVGRAELVEDLDVDLDGWIRRRLRWSSGVARNGPALGRVT